MRSVLCFLNVHAMFLKKKLKIQWNFGHRLSNYYGTIKQLLLDYYYKYAAVVAYPFSTTLKAIGCTVEH